MFAGDNSEVSSFLFCACHWLDVNKDWIFVDFWFAVATVWRKRSLQEIALSYFAEKVGQVWR